MAVNLSKIIILSFISINLFGNDAKEDNKKYVELKNKVIKQQFKNTNKLIIKYEDRLTYCDSLEAKNSFKIKSHKDLNITKENYNYVLNLININTSHNCVSNEKNNYILSVYELLAIFKYYNMDTKIVYTLYSTAFNMSASLLEANITYKEKVAKKTRKYFNSLEELKTPFNVNKVIKLSN